MRPFQPRQFVHEGFVRAPLAHRPDSHILKSSGDLAEVARAPQRGPFLVAISHGRTAPVTAGHRLLHPAWARPRAARPLAQVGARPPAWPRTAAAARPPAATS